MNMKKPKSYLHYFASVGDSSFFFSKINLVGIGGVVNWKNIENNIESKFRFGFKKSRRI